MRRMRMVSISTIIILFVITVSTACNSNTQRENEEASININQIQDVYSTEFSNYHEIPTSFSPQIASYKVKPELENVTNKEDFQFAPEVEQMLVENGFVVIPNRYREFFMLYEMNRYELIPSFITTDSILHNYHLFFSHLLRVVEKEKLVPILEELTESMLLKSQEQYSELKGTAWENAARRNVGFFSVAQKLLQPTYTIPTYVQSEVAEELQLIENSSFITSSPVMNMGQNTNTFELLQEDYTQYIPRGHYDTDEKLQSYFKAMMWYGRMTFRLKNEDETKSALLMTLALKEENNDILWDKIYEPTTFFVGKADDLSYRQFLNLLERIYQEDVSLENVVTNEKNWSAFLAAVAELETPAIHSIPIFDESIQPDRIKETMGFRFMGQRFTLDAVIFQHLIYRNVKENSQNEKRMLPKALDIPAALGSKEAYHILNEMGETDYAGYDENLKKLQQYIATQEKSTWTQNLYWSWLYTLLPLLDECGEGYPSFMTNQAWTRKSLNTFLANWTELKHDTILYAKQTYAEMGGGMDEKDDRGYVEPNPQLYARLAALVQMTSEGLTSRDLLDERDRNSLERLEQLAIYLKEISEKELTNQQLSEEEYDLIRSYGGQLEHFWMEALRDQGVYSRSEITDNPAAIVADVATDPNGQILEEATGYIFDIYAIVPIDGSLRIAHGGVYSHYEFTRLLNERLTDKQWREMLDSNEIPPLAEWTKTFIAP